MFPTFYERTIVIEQKKYKEFYIDSEYGTENLKGMIENVPDSVYKEMTENYDKFYDYQIDKLAWLDYPFDYLKYFNKFPKIEIAPENEYGNYICAHLKSSSNFEHCLEQFYITRLVCDLDKYCGEKGLKLYLISTPELNKYYEEALKSATNTVLFNGRIDAVCNLIINCKGMISTDSGFRYIANCINVPVITFTRNCYAPFQPFESHHVRWLINKDEIFPLNWNTKDVLDNFKKKMDNRIYRLFPNIQDKRQLIIRNYTVNLQKSILNE